MTGEAFPDPRTLFFSDESRRIGASSELTESHHERPVDQGTGGPVSASFVPFHDTLLERPMRDSTDDHANSGADSGDTDDSEAEEGSVASDDALPSDDELVVDAPVAVELSTVDPVAEYAAADFPAGEDSVTAGEPLSAEARRAERMARCEQRIGYEFRDKQLLQGALTHASGAQHRLASNERLEFLGDAVLGLFVCELLFHRHPEFQEGDLTRVKSVVVSRQTCAKLSTLLGLDEFLILGKGMASNRSVPQSLMADVFESLVAALYLDGGSDVVREFLGRYITPEIALVTSGAQSDNYKSLLQQFSQRKLGATPTYQLLDEKGPDHSKCFLIRARVGGREFPPAWGRNKKEAEQRAACNAMAFLNEEPLPFPAE